MSSSLSGLVDNLSERVHSEKCTDCKSCLDYMITQDHQLIFRCFEGKKNYNKDFNKELINRFSSTNEFCNGDINKFVLLLRKGVYPYEYMDGWERFDETSLSDKEAFYSSLNMEDITDVDHRRVLKIVNNKNLGDYHDLHVQSDTLLLADVFEKFRNKCIEIYELDPTHFLSAPGLAWQTCLKKTEVKLELLTDADMLLMVEKGIRGGICYAIHRYANANNKYMKNYDKNKESSYIQYLDAKNLYGWAMSQNLSVDGLIWRKKMSKFNEEFIKSYGEDSDKGYILEVDVKYPKNLNYLHSDLPFLPGRKKINKCRKLLCNLYDKTNYVVQIRSLKQAIDHGLIFQKVHRVIQFNQEAWLREYIDMNIELRKQAKNHFEKDFFKLMNNSVFGKTMENVRKHRDIKLVTTDK